MPYKNLRSVFRKLGDLLETRVDILVFLQELALEPGAFPRVTRRSFGHSPTVIARHTPLGTRARVLSFPAPQSNTTKAV